MIKLTARQEEILGLIRDAIETTGFPPTRAEIANELGFRSANAAEEHLQALARKGAIEISPGTSRGIRLLDRPVDGKNPPNLLISIGPAPSGAHATYAPFNRPSCCRITDTG